MDNVELLVRLEAKPGAEGEVANLLHSGLEVVEGESGMVASYAIRLGPSRFGIFDTFADDGERQACLNGQVRAALAQNAGALLSQPPTVEKVDVLAAKPPKQCRAEARPPEQI